MSGERAGRSRRETARPTGPGVKMSNYVIATRSSCRQTAASLDETNHFTGFLTIKRHYVVFGAHVPQGMGKNKLLL